MSTSTGTTSSASSATTSQSGRTLTFAAAAVACLAITAGIESANRPAPIKEFGRVGEEFYPEFKDPTLASALQVYAFDTKEVKPQEFIVERKENGRWSIPSHHDYPADAEDQLAKTAASVIGIKRGAMVTRWPADHAGYGVVNPKQDSLKVDEVDGVGKRLILRGNGDAVLVDYIIGNESDSDKSNEYYVRHPDQDEVYIASLSIDLSTKFADWIDTDLLHISQSDMRQLTINDYAFDELQGTLTKGDTSILKRENSSDPWVLDGLNEDTEEVDKEAMRNAANAIADMKIVGVRKKRPGLTPDLKLDRTALKSQNDLERLQNDLMSKGFILQPDTEPEALKLIAREGELYAATEDGLNYRMHFGRAFTGSLQELEVELNSGDEAADNEPKDEKDDDDTDKDGTDENSEEESKSDDDDSDADTDDEEEESKSQTGRYVFVRVEFEESNLGERPVEPVAPEMPEELKQAEEEKTAEDEAASDDDADKEEKAAADTEGEAAAEDSDSENEEDAEEDPLAGIRETYESGKKSHEVDMATYEADLKAFEKKIEDGTKKAEQLNRRFADWYYVIAGESFDKLQLSRKDIVKEKEKKEDEEPKEIDTDSADAATPKVDETAPVDSAEDGEKEPGTEDSPGEEPATEEPATEEPATEEPATEEPATEEPATEEPATEEPATEEPATEEPATEEPATEEPATEEPATEEPATEEPAAEEEGGSESPQDAPAEPEKVE